MSQKNIKNESSLSENEEARYARNIIISNIGQEGQKKLKSAKVLIIGTGGLGSPTALYLAAAGIGTLGLVDFDVVDVSNLQRQLLHTTPDIDRLKVESAAEKIGALNPHVNIRKHHMKVTKENVVKLLEDYDVIAECTDNFDGKFLINDTCVEMNKPLVFATVVRFEGQATTIIPGESPCFRCIFEEPPPPEMAFSGRTSGILGAVAGAFGALQAAEVVKVIINQGNLLTGKLLMWNLFTHEIRKMEIQKNPHCPACGKKA